MITLKIKLFALYSIFLTLLPLKSIKTRFFYFFFFLVKLSNQIPWSHQ